MLMTAGLPAAEEEGSRRGTPARNLSALLLSPLPGVSATLSGLWLSCSGPPLEAPRGLALQKAQWQTSGVSGGTLGCPLAVGHLDWGVSLHLSLASP